MFYWTFLNATYVCFGQPAPYSSTGPAFLLTLKVWGKTSSDSDIRKVNKHHSASDIMPCVVWDGKA